MRMAWGGRTPSARGRTVTTRNIVFTIVSGLLIGESRSHSEVVTFECATLPENVGWERTAFQPIERFIVAGWFVHYVDYLNETDTYRRPLAVFAGVSTFFVEWRAESDAPASILDFSGTPAVVSAGGRSGVNYHFTFTDSKVRIWRTNFLPIIYLDILPGVPHTYRLEVCGPPSCLEDQYAWYIDGILGDSGQARGPYPTESSVLLWATRRQMFDSTTSWDYVRHGVIAQPGSGDFDSSETIDLFDFYFFHECLTNERIGINGGPDNDSGPGCRFADFDADADVDLLDFATFQNLFDGKR